MQNIEVKKTPSKGLGVFATKNFKNGDIIENVPVLIISDKEADQLEGHTLGNYYYCWKETLDEYGAFPCGYGPFYNHSETPNAKVDRDFENNLLIFRAIKDIAKGSEILVKYQTVWFDVKE